jgi:hypothetical protein
LNPEPLVELGSVRQREAVEKGPAAVINDGCENLDARTREGARDSVQIQGDGRTLQAQRCAVGVKEDTRHTVVQRVAQVGQGGAQVRARIVRIWPEQRGDPIAWVADRLDGEEGQQRERLARGKLHGLAIQHYLGRSQQPQRECSHGPSHDLLLLAVYADYDTTTRCRRKGMGGQCLPKKWLCRSL